MCVHLCIEPHKTTAVWSCPFAIMFNKSGRDLILQHIGYMYQGFFLWVFCRYEEGIGSWVWGFKQMQKSEAGQIKTSA